ncbi:MAG: helicase RepA family protein [Defluviitaleaceae bacterium]|nr:helicase RepA family protein [Defluviitaleaceae bacterium]
MGKVKEMLLERGVDLAKMGCKYESFFDYEKTDDRLPWETNKTPQEKTVAEVVATNILELNTKTAKEIMETNFDAPHFIVDNMFTSGIYLLAGAAKAGKSWLALDIAASVASGEPFWEHKTTKSDVLYMSLEDTDPLLAGRLKQMQANPKMINNLHITHNTRGMDANASMVQEIENFLKKHPNTKLIIIDILSKIRHHRYDIDISVNDRKFVENLRPITNNRDIVLLLLHHTRKMHDDDPINMVAGSMALVGAVDGTYVLMKKSRKSKQAKFTTGVRHIRDFSYNIEFDEESCKWQFLGVDNDEEDEEENAKASELAYNLKEYIFSKNGVWQGTATMLCASLNDLAKREKKDIKYFPTRITRQLKAAQPILLEEYGIVIRRDKDKNSRMLYFYKNKSTTGQQVQQK